jgi:AraC-like DNA-binding protein
MPRNPRIRRYPLAPLPSGPLPAGLPNVHAVLVPAVAHAFETLRISAALRDEVQWHAIHSPPQPLHAMELEHGKERERQAYNNRCSEKARRQKKTVLGHHAGFSDFFVPIATSEKVHTLLVTGPFATARPTSTDLLQRWHWLTGRRGHPSDPEFVRYVSSTLDALLLEGEQLRRYQRMLECLAALCAGHGDAHALGSEASGLRTVLEVERFADHTWEAARTMVDERTARTWLTPHKLNELWAVGLRQAPEHVLIGLWVDRQGEADAVGQMLAHDTFLRACVELARASGNAVCGRVLDHGVMFLAGGAETAARSRALLLRLGDQANGLARRSFGLALHLGASAPKSSEPINVRYEEALGAAESALSQGVPIVTAAPGLRATMSPLRRIREQLGDIMEERPMVLSTRFERYIEAVCVHCGYRIEAVRAHLDAGFDRAVQVLRRTGVLEERSRLDTYDALDRAARDAPTVSELVSAYRRAVLDLIAAAEHPVPAAQDRKLRRSLAFIGHHFTEPIGLADVARVAGFAPRHFARLFKRRESTTFEAYVRKLRIERAKQLLAGTDLSVERVAQLSGFVLRPHFHRVFKQIVGTTPAEFRSS